MGIISKKKEKNRAPLLTEEKKSLIRNAPDGIPPDGIHKKAVKTLQKKMKNINSIIGQTLAKEQLSGLFSVIDNASGAPIKPRLLEGPSGTGKTFTIDKLCADLSERGYFINRIDDCDSIALQSGANTEKVVNAINASQSCPTVLVLDEAQKIFKGSRNKSAMERDLCQFIFPHGDKVQSSITGNIAGTECRADFRNLVLIVATNERASLETAQSRAKGEAPFSRRFSVVELTNYSQSEMEEIIPSYFNAIGFKIGDCASAMVRRLHRGNMEALKQVAEKITERVFGKSTLNKDDILSACRVTEFLPRGLRRAEVRLLEALETHDLPRARAMAVSGIQGKLFDQSINHMVRQFAENKAGERVPFDLLFTVGSKYRLSDAGKRYLASVRKEGFTW